MDAPSAPRQRGRARVKSATRARVRRRSTSRQHGHVRDESPPEQRARGRARVQSSEDQRERAQDKSQGQRGNARVKSSERRARDRSPEESSRDQSPPRRRGRARRHRSPSGHHGRAESQHQPPPRGRTQLQSVLTRLAVAWRKSAKQTGGHAWPEMAPRLLLGFAAVLIVEAVLEYLIATWYDSHILHICLSVSVCM